MENSVVWEQVGFTLGNHIPTDKALELAAAHMSNGSILAPDLRSSMPASWLSEPAPALFHLVHRTSKVGARLRTCCVCVFFVGLTPAPTAGRVSPP